MAGVLQGCDVFSRYPVSGGKQSRRGTGAPDSNSGLLLWFRRADGAGYITSRLPTGHLGDPTSARRAVVVGRLGFRGAGSANRDVSAHPGGALSPRRPVPTL